MHNVSNKNFTNFLGAPDNCQTIFSSIHVFNNNTCLKCNKVFINKHNLSKHLLEVHGQKLSSQDTKEFQYQLSKNGKKMRLKKIPPKQTCIICDKVLINNYNLKRHLMSVHKINANDTSSFMLSARTSKQLTKHVDLNAATNKGLVSSFGCELNTNTHMAVNNNNNNTDFKQSNNVQKFQVSNYNSHIAIDNIVSNQQNDDLYFIPDQPNKTQPIPTYDNTVTLYKAQPLETDIVENYHNVDTYATSNWPKEIQAFLENSDNIQITENKYGSDKLNTQFQGTENDNTLYNQSNQTQISKTYKNEMQVESYDYTLFDQINKIQNLQTSDSDMEISGNSFAMYNPTKQAHEIPTYGDNTMTLYNTQTLETNTLHSYGAENTHVASSWPESVKTIETNNDNMQTIIDNYNTSDEMNQVWPHQMFDYSMSLAKNNGTSHNQSNQAQICEAYNDQTQLEPHKYTVFDHLNKVQVLEVPNNGQTQIDLDTYAKPEQLNKEPTFQMLSDETQSIANNDTVLKQPNNEQIPQSLNSDTHISVSHTVTNTSDTVLTPNCEMYCAMPIDNIMSDLTHSDDTSLNTPILPNDTQTTQTYSDHSMTTLNTQTLETNNSKTHESKENSIMPNEPSTHVQKEPSYFCQDCNVQFQNKSMLLKHTLSMHKTKQKPPKLNVSKQIKNQCAICPICNKQLRKDYLKKHLKNVHHQEMKIIPASDKIFYADESDTNVKACVPTNNIVSHLPTIDLKQNDNSCLMTSIQPNDTQTIQTYGDHVRATLNTQTLEINNPIKQDFTEKSVMSNKSCIRKQKYFTHLCQNCNLRFQSKLMLMKHTREMHNAKQKEVKSEVDKQKIVQCNKNVICHICNNQVQKTYLMTHLKNMHKHEMNVITKTDTIFCIENVTNVEAHVTTNNMSDLPSADLSQNDNACLVTSSRPQADQKFSDHEVTTLDTQTSVTNSPTIRESTEKSVMSNEPHTRGQENLSYLCQDYDEQFQNKLTLLKHTQKMRNIKALDVSQQKLPIPEIPKHEIIQNKPNVNCHECGKSVRKNYLKRHMKTMHEKNTIFTEKSDKSFHNESSVVSDLSNEKSDCTSHNESNVNIEAHVTTNDVMSDLPIIIDLTQNDNTRLDTSGQPNGTQTAQTYSDPKMTTPDTQASESNEPKTRESVEESAMSDESSTRVQKKLSYHCRDCNVQFRSKSALLKHAREVHSAKQKQIKSEFPKKKLVQNKRNTHCHICSKQMRLNYLKIHLKNIHKQETIAPVAKTMPSRIESDENIEHCVNNNDIASDPPTRGDNTCSVVVSGQPDDARTVRACGDRTDAVGEHETTDESVKIANLQDNGDGEMQAAADACTVSDSSCESQGPPRTPNGGTPIDERRENAALDRSDEVQACGAESPIATSVCDDAEIDRSISEYVDETQEAEIDRIVELQNIENLMMLAKVAHGGDGWLFDLLTRPFITVERTKLTMVWTKCTVHESCIYSDGTHATFDEIQREMDADNPGCVTDDNDMDSTELGNADDANAKSVDVFECVAVPNRLNILITRKKGHVARGKTRTEPPGVLARKKHHCKFCDVSFKSRKSYVEHVEYVHKTLKQAIKCDRCHYMFATEHLYHDHLETAHKNGKSPNECDVCNKEFRTKHELKKHFKHRHGGRPYKCSMCDYIFFKESNRDLHMVSAHDCFKCDICYLKFDSQSMLDSHKNGHTQTRMFVCDYLSCAHLPFPTKKRLKDHLKLHGD